MICPRKSLKKLPGFAGNTNVMDVTEKPGAGLHDGTPEGYGGAEKAEIRIGQLTNIFISLAQVLDDLLRGRRYPVKSLFGAVPQIARNSGTYPQPIPQT
jgi:hypothetical protein